MHVQVAATAVVVVAIIAMLCSSLLTLTGPLHTYICTYSTQSERSRAFTRKFSHKKAPQNDRTYVHTSIDIYTYMYVCTFLLPRWGAATDLWAKLIFLSANRTLGFSCDSLSNALALTWGWCRSCCWYCCLSSSLSLALLLQLSASDWVAMWLWDVCVCVCVGGCVCLCANKNSDCLLLSCIYLSCCSCLCRQEKVTPSKVIFFLIFVHSFVCVCACARK